MATGILPPIISADIFKPGTILPTGTDLNSVTTRGRYSLPDLANVTNLPTTATSADLIVMARASSARIWQIAFMYQSSTPSVWFRAQSGETTFTSWLQLG